jgi:hypothetical protein
MTEPKTRKAAPAEPDAIVFSNAVRLTGRDWIVVGVFTIALVAFAPSLWKQQEKFPTETDYRTPHDLSNDYWLFERWAGLAADRYDTLLFGDSVVWGEYTNRQETLSHYLNEIGGRERFANLGLDGAHPLALCGLIDNYARDVSGKNVVLLCNPLWMSSPKADLQDEKATEFSHPRLVPQFVPSIPAYPLERKNTSERIGIVVERQLPLYSWTNHLQLAYYDKTDIPGWTLEHPDDNPLEPLRHGLPPLDNSSRHLPLPWYASGIREQDYPWVDLETSLQWRAFQRTVKVLQERGNRVFVLVGPFNEHLLEPGSRQRYQKVKDGIVAWLQARQIPHLAPAPLPSDDYGDASHPLAAGYSRLARLLLNEPFFQ